MQLALLQLNPKVGDLVANRARIAAKVQSLEMQPDLIISSELSLVGYPPRDLLLQPAFIRRCWQEVQLLAQDLMSCAPILVGLPELNPEPVGRPLYNSAVLLHEGQIKQIIRKSLLPTYDVFDEDRYFEPRQGNEIVIIKGQRIGVCICEDLWNDRDYWERPRYHYDPVQYLIDQKVDLIVNLSASPYIRNKQIFREDLLSKLAYKHKVALAYVNQVGGNDDLIFDGYSCVFDAQGQIIARAPGFIEEVLLVGSQGGCVAPLLEPEAELWTALVLGTRDYAQKCGFKKALLGLSGGIDSALTAAIACAALGAEQVLGVLMPSPYSSLGSIEDSIQLAKNLGIKTITLPIEPLMKGYDKTLAEAFIDYPQDITEENIQSRIRGNLMMALSNKYGALLLTTGNKSELSVGYCTLYGDMCGGLAVIADLPKTQVYSLSAWLNRQTPVIPEIIITKPPSAELRPDQKDQDSLPPYDLLDAILERHIEGFQDAQELIEAGYAADVVQRVLGLVRIAEFKRRQIPPGLKVTDRAFGTGWRMPIARGNS